MERDCNCNSLGSLEDIVGAAENRHCLVRPYLGRADGEIAKYRFSLRNFPLYLKSMGLLGVDVTGPAVSMGKEFALMHWGARVNGDEVEFVLGTSMAQGRGDGNFDFQHRAVRFYLLDIGQCEFVDLTKDPKDVYQAFKGAMVSGDNQLFIPYYRKTLALFAAFKEGYIRAGQLIVKEKKPPVLQILTCFGQLNDSGN